MGFRRNPSEKPGKRGANRAAWVCKISKKYTDFPEKVKSRCLGVSDGEDGRVTVGRELTCRHTPAS